MKSLIVRSTLLAGLGIAVLTIPAFAISRTTIQEAPLVKSKSAQIQLAVNPYDCFTDDGYGRKRPCSSTFKKKKKAKAATK
jgi:hypothetical protein